MRVLLNRFAPKSEGRLFAVAAVSTVFQFAAYTLLLLWGVENLGAFLIIPWTFAIAGVIFLIGLAFSSALPAVLVFALETLAGIAVCMFWQWALGENAPTSVALALKSTAPLTLWSMGTATWFIMFFTREKGIPPLPARRV